MEKAKTERRRSRRLTWSRIWSNIKETALILIAAAFVSLLAFGMLMSEFFNKEPDENE